MPLDDHEWTNCRKCGHRYWKDKSTCPRCETKTRRVPKGIVKGIVIGVTAIVAIAFLVSMAGTFQSFFSNIGSVDAQPKEPAKPTDAETARKIVELVSQERVDRGMNALAWSDELARVGQEHSDRMVRTKLFEHSGNKYYNCMGENLLLSPTGPITAERVMSIWMTSPGHRDAILFESHVSAGVGIATAPKDGSLNAGTTYYTLIMQSSLC